MDDLVIENVIDCIKNGKTLTVKNLTKNAEIPVTCELSDRAIEIVLAGGLLSYTKSKLN